MNSLRQRACWKAADARAILSTEATEGDKRIFLATHSPIRDFEIGGSRAADVREKTEDALFDALSSLTTEHAFCVVEGEPGSGKSHLIRWFHIKWPFEEDLVLLIQRADGSLEGTLRQIQAKLPEEYQYLFDSIGTRQDISLSGRARLFHATLANSLRSDFFETPPSDAAWCSEWDLAELLGNSQIADEWKAPERILNILSGKKGERNQELARFNISDVAELELILRQLTVKSMRALRFSRMLQKEAENIRLLTSQQLLEDEEALRQSYENSYRLVDALNYRRNSAVQTLLGISSEGLKELFMRLRRELKSRRLVLLLEDITAWEGVDNQLVDVLVTNRETREDKDLCPLVSMVGITPEYFRSAGFHANYRQRITHHIRLGHESSDHQYQDVSSLRIPQNQIAFAAKYLRAIRAGLDNLPVDGNNSVPNSCDLCPTHEECIAAFGEFQGVSLFPFNEKAITSIYNSLEDPERTSTLQTPRGMIQGVLVPTLLQPQLIDANQYPGKEIEIDWIPEERRRLNTIAQGIIEAQIAEEAEKNRMRRLVAYWGEDSNYSTRKDDTSALTYFGVRQEIYRTFDLPWLGADKEEQTTEPIVEEDKPVSRGDNDFSINQQENTTEVINQDNESGSQTTTTTATRTTTTGTTTTKKRPASLPRQELRKLANDIADWMDEKRPANPVKLNQFASEIVGQIPWYRLGIPDWLQGRLFTNDTVILKGTKTERSQYFVIQNVDWAKFGLEAYANLKTARSELDEQEEETYLRRYASMMRKLKGVAKEHAKRRVPQLPGNVEWSSVGTITQMLLVRNWLRGTVKPLDPPYIQWQSILKDEELATSSPNERVDSWKDVVDRTGGSHAKWREVLRKLTNLPQGDSTVQSITDSSEAVVAIETVKNAFKIAPLPERFDGGTQLSELSILVSVANEVNKRLPGIPKFEKDRIIRYAKEVEELLRNSTIREHIKRLSKIIEAVSKELPSAAYSAVADWARIEENFKREGYTGDEPAGRALEQFIDIVNDTNEESEELAASLNWSLLAPVANLKTVREGLLLGEKTVQELLAYVESYLSGLQSGEQGLETLQEFGNNLAEISGLILGEE